MHHVCALGLLHTLRLCCWGGGSNTGRCLVPCTEGPAAGPQLFPHSIIPESVGEWHSPSSVGECGELVFAKGTVGKIFDLREKGGNGTAQNFYFVPFSSLSPPFFSCYGSPSITFHRCRCRRCRRSSVCWHRGAVSRAQKGRSVWARPTTAPGQTALLGFGQEFRASADRTPRGYAILLLSSHIHRLIRAPEARLRIPPPPRLLLFRPRLPSPVDQQQLPVNRRQLTLN